MSPCIILLLLIISCQSICTTEVDELTNNFFINLVTQLTDASSAQRQYRFVDKQVDNFMHLINERYANQNRNRRKRQTVSINGSDSGVQILETIQPLGKISATSRDLALFTHNVNGSPVWYAAVLQSNKLLIFKQNNAEFQQIEETSIRNGVRLGIFTANRTFIVVAENSTKHVDFYNKTAVYVFDSRETLQKVQNLHIDYASDVAIWSDKRRTFMAIPEQFQSIAIPGTATLEEELSCGQFTIIFQWLGGHFDIIQKLNTSCAVRVTPFSIGKSQFIAIGNGGNRLKESGEVREVFSEIFKYDLDMEQFVSYQKLATVNVSDLQFFAFKGKQHQESFLIIANAARTLVYKFVDGYFLPFQCIDEPAVKQWLPITGDMDEFALFGVTQAGNVVIYQYDGWTFVPLSMEVPTSAVSSLRHFKLNQSMTIAVSYEDNSAEGANLYQLQFKSKNYVQKHSENILEWCSRNKNFLTRTTSKRSVDERKLAVVNLRSVEADLSNGTNIQNNLAFVEIQMENLDKQLFRVEGKLSPQLPTPGEMLHIEGDFNSNRIIINNDISFSGSILAKNLNGLDVANFLDGIVLINQDTEIHLQALEMSKATVNNNFPLKIINGHPYEDLMLKSNINQVHNLQIDGILRVNSLQVRGTVNNIIFNTSNILLKEGDQTFDGDLSIERIQALNVNAPSLNGVNLTTLAMNTSIPQRNETIQVSHLERLSVKHLTIAGFLNNLDLPTVDKHALKRSGDQEISAEYLFDNLEFGNLDSNNLSGVAIPDNLILTSAGNFSIPHDVQLTQDLHIKNLTVTNRLNQIHVHQTSGKLDVLLNNHTEMQFISGQKIIQDMELLKPMKLQGKIESHSLTELNPVSRLDVAVDLEGDYVITGNVTIEKSLEAQDLVTEDGRNSIGYLKEHGLRLTDEEVPVKLNFTQPIDVIDIFADTINGVDTSKWIVNGGSEPQIINGWKTFQGDVAIIGATNLHILNDVNVPKLDSDVLTIEGNQVVTGKHIFRSMEAPSIESNITMLNSSTLMEAAIANSRHKEVSQMSISQLSVDKLEARNIEVKNNFNGINVVEMFEDTLFKGQKNVKVSGAKRFASLNITYLTSRKSMNMNRIPTLIERGEAVTGVNTNLKLGNVDVERITFKNYLNNVSAENFHDNWLANEKVQTVHGDQVLNKVVIYGSLKVMSDEINHLNLGKMVLHTVKSDEEHDFGNITFGSGIICSSLLLKGHIENLDMNNILAENGKEILTSLTFLDSVTILKPIRNEATINGLNLSDLCHYGHPHANEPPKKLTIEGHSVLLKHPIIQNINGQSMAELTNAIWFNDLPSNLTCHLNATQITFLDDVQVHGLVDGVNMQWLNANYFSKTSNQSVPATITFAEGIRVLGLLTAPSAHVSGSVNGVNLNEFIANVLLQGWNQTFEDVVFIEDCSIDHLRGDFKVNEQNLKTDVLRYSGENVVTGKTIIGNLNVGYLNLSRNVRVQNVDLIKWTQDGILRSGSHKIEGRLVFGNFTVFENGVGLTGFLNRHRFNKDKVMLKSQAQTITGRKTFLHGPVTFENIKIRGTFNTINIADTIQQQALQNKDNTFETRVDFHTNLVAQNVNFNGLFNGVNISQLIHNLSRTAFVNNYYENYSKLEETSKAIQKSLEHPAYFLNHFTTLQRLAGLFDVIPMRSVNGQLNLVTLRYYNESYILDFFKWSEQPRSFNVDSAMKEIFFQETVTQFMPLEYDFGSYLYVEVEYLDGNGNTRMGNVMSNHIADTFKIIAYIPSNGTLDVLALFLPKVQKTCLLLVHAQMPYMDIYCQGDKIMILHQRLPITNPMQVRVGKLANMLEIVAIERPLGKNATAVPTITIWRYDENTELFNQVQRIFSATPISIALETHNSQRYLAIASTHLLNTMYTGQIDVKRYDPTTQRYHNWQVLKVSVPVQVELAVLPSNELLMYVLRENPTEALAIFQYAGIAKFQHRGAISTLSNCDAIVPFSSQRFKEHFIIAKCNDGVDIIQSIFKH